MLQATMTRPAEKNGMMTKTKREPILRVVPRPGDINANGHIFGGWVLSQMDIAAGIVASYRAQGPVATVAIEAKDFTAPSLIHAIITAYAESEREGGPPMGVRTAVPHPSPPATAHG